MKTILQTDRGKTECYICGLQQPLELHHVYYGTGNRRISDENGFTVMLCPMCHRGNKSAHNDRNVDLHLKKHFQRLFEIDNTRKEFIELIGRSYL